MRKALKFSGVPLGAFTWYEDANWRNDPKITTVERAERYGLLLPGETPDPETMKQVWSEVVWTGPYTRVNSGDIVPLESFNRPGVKGWPVEGLDVAQNFIMRGVAEVVEIEDAEKE